MGPVEGSDAAAVVDVVVAAAGSGIRLGATVPKAFVELAGAPLLGHALGPLDAVTPRRVVVTLPAEGTAGWASRLRELWPGRELLGVAGGATRQASVRAGLEALREAARQEGQPAADLILVHDAARPCASAALWRRVRDAAAAHGAAVPVVAVADCLKRIDDDGRVAATVDRQGIVQVQTPQGFRFQRLLEAHRLAEGEEAADDAALVEALGDPVATVAGEPANLKVTTPDDVPVATALLEGRGDDTARVGHGWDIHPLVAGRRLILGGVEIAHPRGLTGHSDADALAHAVTDAVLGAAGLGDIGGMYPAENPRWKDADSLELLRGAVAEVRAAGWRVGNVDATITAEEPPLAPHLPDMADHLAGALGVPQGAVNVKATRGEGLGPVGRGEGIAAHAVALLRRVG